MKGHRVFGVILVVLLLAVSFAPGTARAAASPAPALDEGPQLPPNDARQRPPEVLQRMQAARAAAAASAYYAAAAGAPPASHKPGYYDTSTYMAGSVAVGIIFPESVGSVNTETWDTARMDQVRDEIADALSWWANNTSGPGNLSFTYVQERQVPTSYEPIKMSAATQEGTWIANVMSNLDNPYTSGDYWDRVLAYTNDLRNTYDTDWAFTIFVVDSKNDTDGWFADDYFAYSYIGGPFMVVTYDSDGWRASRGDITDVIAHEMGHIFMAGDQYDSSGCTRTEKFGYLAIANGNCDTIVNGIVDGAPSLMKNGDTASGLDIYARGQIGWRDTDSDGTYDPLEGLAVVLESTPVTPTALHSLSYSGYARVAPWPHATCSPSYNCGTSDITILDIDSIDYSVDDNRDEAPWTDASNDGSLDNDVETFSFTTEDLPAGTHTIYVRATDSYGNKSITSHEVNILGPLNIEGRYDDSIPNITYSGSWTRTTPAGTWQTTQHTTSAAGSYAQVDFTGQRIRAVYTAGSYGTVNVLIDGDPAGSFGQYSDTTAYQRVWNSPALAPGGHTVRFVHAGLSAAPINLDAVEVVSFADLTAPGTIPDLEAASGAAGGSVALTWTAPGDDGSTGAASSYQVRYAAGEITSASDWDNATVVTQSIDPGPAGSTETYTVTGLYPGQTYYFAVRGVDEEGNTGSLSNSPSAMATVPTPVTENVYDDRSTAIVLSGPWMRWRNAGAYLGSYLSIGRSSPGYAQLTFDGSKLGVYYTAGPGQYKLDIYLDGVLLASFNQYNRTVKYRQIWTSERFTYGTHTARFVSTGGNSLDAIRVYGPPDITPPAAVTVTAGTGTGEGSATLSWTAPGDDGSSGKATSYLVRYSLAAITDDTTWGNATVVKSGLPAPVTAGGAQSMTISGLLPGAIYHFVVRAVDDEGNVAALSNSASATAKAPAAVLPGTYDDQQTSIVKYKGSWGSARIRDAYKVTLHSSRTPASYAHVTFNGQRVSIVYATGPTYGTMRILIDGTQVGLVDQYSLTTKSQQVWHGPALAAGVHTVHMLPNSSTPINVDAVQITNAPDTTAPDAISGMLAAPGTAEASVALTFTAPGDDGSTGMVTGYQVRYATTEIADSEDWDAATPFTGALPTLVAAGSSQTITVTGLAPGTTYYFAVRAVDDEGNLGGLSNSPSSLPSDPLARGAGLYDDTHAAWRYTGNWQAAASSSAYDSTLHASQLPGSYADFTMNGTQFALRYSAASTRGSLAVYVDGSLAHTIDAGSSTTRWQQVWTSETLSAGTHQLHLVFTGPDGKLIDIDAIQVYDSVTLNLNPPAAPVKLVFIHHSTGGNWLAESWGGLGHALMDNNYYVSATNYGWGPYTIGDRTDIPNWLEWFAGSNTSTIMSSVYSAGDQNLGGYGSWPRLSAIPSGDNEIIVFKSCFPNSNLTGNPTDPASASDPAYSVGHSKYVYNTILTYFAAHQDKLFVVITAPPLLAANTSTANAANARAFNEWLMNDWLSDAGYAYNNVVVFDFYNVLTGPNNHHRYSNGAIEHTYTAGMNTLYSSYGSSASDDHPNATASQKATTEFLNLLNIFYNRWKGNSSVLTGSGPAMAGCPVFPASNIWNTRVDGLPVHSLSSQWIDSIGRTTGFHMDFGSGTWDGGPIGIPFNIVDGTAGKVPVSFYYPDESDAGPYPIPASPLREYGSDHHILILDRSTCTLYEIYDASKVGSAWNGGSGAIWDLTSNALRPDGWTSADAAGLPILPGLVRYDEIAAGHIHHALRFTASQTNRYTWPARHLTSDDDTPNIPPMGARFRLKEDYDISDFPAQMQVILTAMKEYGIILADNGADWYVSGAPDERWNNDMLHLLDVLTGDDFEAVDETALMVSPGSGVTSGAYATVWHPAVGATWQWQLDGTINTSVNAGVYDLDLFETPASTVSALHAGGKKVICYISVGSWEDWRPDAGDFPSGVLGNDYEGWPGEKWLDIRQIDTLAPIMRARLDLCKQKGFDAVEPDNIEGYDNNSGFPLTAQDQLAYNIWLANEAHARGLSIGLKNDPAQVNDLLTYFDWALTEDCFDQGWCADMNPFIAAGKPVFAAEYTDTGITLGDFCSQAASMQFSAILKHRNLDAYRQTCP
jgi:hypothetical protein